MIAKPTVARIPWIALSLSFLSAGLGHIYCGRIGKGLILFCAWFLLPVAAIAAAFLEPSTAVLVGLILAPACGMVVLYVYAAVNAFHCAKVIGHNYTLKEYNRGIVYCLLIAVGLIYPISVTSGIKAFVFEAFYIPARNMSPNVLKGDRLLVNKIACRSDYPQRGELVVFRNPSAGGNVFIERVVALAGDTVEMRAGEVFVNAKPLEKVRVPLDALSSIKNQLNGDVFYENNAGNRYRVMLNDKTTLSDAQAAYRHFAETTVPERSVFVLGDNRDRSNDSRKFGFIHIGDIIGYAQYTYWPAEAWSRFGVYRD